MKRENTEVLERLDHYADSIQRGVHVSGTQMRTLLLELHAAQQPAATDGARRVMHELCDCPNGRAEHAEWCAARAAQQPAAVDEMAELVGLLDEVRSHFTRDDDLPDDLLPRIDAALRWIAGGAK